MKEILVSVIVLLLAGCASNDITIYKMVEGTPVPIVEIEQGFGGKGCIAVEADPATGKASVIVQQAGTSDWSVSRLFGFIGDTAGSFFGGTRGMQEMQGPATGMQGCEGIFGDVVEDNEDTPTTYLLTPAKPDE